MARPRSEKRRVINSVQRALDILNLFSTNAPELGTTDIARALNLHKSTVSGLVRTLEQNGYLAQNPETRQYRLGLRLLERSSVLLSHIDIRQISQSHLRALRDWCNENVNLAVQDDTEVVYIERLLGSQTLGMRPRVGKRAPIYSTALGKAVLAWLPPDERERYIARMAFEPMTPNTITDAERFRKVLEETRERCYSIDREEDQIGGCCISAPVFDHTGYPVAAISISAPIQRMPESAIEQFGQRIRETARAISNALGYQKST